MGLFPKPCPKCGVNSHWWHDGSCETCEGFKGVSSYEELCVKLDEYMKYMTHISMLHHENIMKSFRDSGLKE